MKKFLKRTFVYDVVLARRLHRLTQQDRQAMDFLRPLIAPGDLVFDVGANFGQKTRLYYHLGATVVAVEPMSECADYLRRQSRFSRGRIKPVPMAVGRTTGLAKLRREPASTCISTLSDEYVRKMQDVTWLGQPRWEVEEQVQVTTLDELIRQYGTPRLLKLDVEGYEVEALAGLSQKIGIIIFEYLPYLLDNGLACVERLRSFGRFNYNVTLSDGSTFIRPQWRPDTQLADEIRGPLSQANTFCDIFVSFER